MKKSVESRLSKLEANKPKEQGPAWVIFKDGDDLESLPEGVKAYHASIDPDLWDREEKHEKAN